MALIIKDRVQETSTTAGTGNLTLNGAAAGFQSFVPAIGFNNTTYYAIVDVSAGTWEVGLGTIVSQSGATLLVRSTVLESSAGGVKVDFTSNSKDVFCTYPAERALVLNADERLVVTKDVFINGVRVGRGFVGVPSNTALGQNTLSQDAFSQGVTAIGASALQNNTTGTVNTAVGSDALQSNTTGGENTACGESALGLNTTGFSNTALGRRALRLSTTGIINTALGGASLQSNTTGTGNVAVGVASVGANTTGSNNTGIGRESLKNNTTGSGNTAIGAVNSAGTYAPVFDPTTEINRFCLGSTSVTNAYIQVALTVVSDARDKTNFAPVPHGLEFVKALQPTAYKFRVARDSEETQGGVRYGFKAQDVLALEGEHPVIVDNEDAGKLRMTDTALIPVLVKAIQEQQSMIESLTNRLMALESK